MTFRLAKTVFNNEWNARSGWVRTQITVNCKMAIPQNVEQNDEDVESKKELKMETEGCHAKVLILDIVLPLVDLSIDLTKAMLLLFDYSFISFSSFATHFNSKGVYGLISLMLKWTPAIVTILHFQDVNRCFEMS